MYVIVSSDNAEPGLIKKEEEKEEEERREQVEMVKFIIINYIFMIKHQ